MDMFVVGAKIVDLSTVQKLWIPFRSSKPKGFKH